MVSDSFSHSNHCVIITNHYQCQTYHIAMIFYYRTPLIRLNKLSEATGMWHSNWLNNLKVLSSNRDAWTYSHDYAVISTHFLPCKKKFSQICPNIEYLTWAMPHFSMPPFSTGCNITVKAEYLNPGGSVKDRAAFYLLKDAEEKGFAIWFFQIGIHFYMLLVLPIFSLHSQKHARCSKSEHCSPFTLQSSGWYLDAFAPPW